LIFFNSEDDPDIYKSEADLEEPAAVACTCIHENHQPLIKINIERGSQVTSLNKPKIKTFQF